MTAGHAFCAPSDWEGWSVCAGKPALEETESDVSSASADLGKEAHDHAHQILQRWGLAPEEMPDAVFSDVPEEMRSGVKLYVEAVRARVAAFRLAGARVTILVEQRLDISVITGEKDAQGTADCILIAEFAEYSVLEVWDFKSGYHPVAVMDNGQLQIYALAAFLTHGIFHNFTEINLVIHQPRVRKEPSEWRRTPDELYIFGAKVTEAATLSLSLRGDVTALSHLTPGERQCRFCRVKYRCPALLKAVHQDVYGEFQKLDDPAAVPVAVEDKVLQLPPVKKAEILSRAMKRVPLIESWCLAVRAACDDAMLNEGLNVPDFKVVMGRKGLRRWRDTDAVLSVVDEAKIPRAAIMTEPQLLSPAQCEKVFEKRTTPPEWSVVWGAMQIFVEQSDGKPSVAPATDPRQPWTDHGAEDFDTYEGKDLV